MVRPYLNNTIYLTEAHCGKFDEPFCQNTYSHDQLSKSSIYLEVALKASMTSFDVS